LSLLEYVDKRRTGLPDGLFFFKSQFGQTLEGLCWANVDIFYGQMEYFKEIWDLYFMTIWYVFYIHLLHLLQFWIIYREESGNPGEDGGTNACAYLQQIDEKLRQKNCQ
jgi:hypothetical protein